MSRCTKKNCPMVGVSADCDLKDCLYRTEADQSKDLIYREDAIKAINQVGWLEDSEYESRILAIPSADRPQGGWIDNGFGSKCSKCGFSLVGGEYNYCPNCGTKMINVSERWEHPCRCCALSKDICKIAFTDEYKHCIYIKGKE